MKLLKVDYWLRPYQEENTTSRPISEVKPLRARLVLGLEITREHRVSQSLFYIFNNFAILIYNCNFDQISITFSQIINNYKWKLLNPFWSVIFLIPHFNMFYYNLLIKVIKTHQVLSFWFFQKWAIFWSIEIVKFFICLFINFHK